MREILLGPPVVQPAAGVEAIAYAGDGVYALRELQTAGSGPISATTATSLLASLISR